MRSPQVPSDSAKLDPIGAMTMRLRTSRVPMRPGCSRLSKAPMACLPLGQEIDAATVEECAMLHLHPVAALVEQDHACVRRILDHLQCAAVRVELVVGAPEAEDRCLELVQAR